MVLEGHNLTVSRKKGMLPRVPFLDLKEKILSRQYELSIVFIDPETARAVNIERRGKDYVPNTLSFELTKHSGEILLCLPAIYQEHKAFGMPKQDYLLYIVIHSMLHLKGMQHGSTMERKEKELLAFFTSR